MQTNQLPYFVFSRRNMQLNVTYNTALDPLPHYYQWIDAAGSCGSD